MFEQVNESPPESESSSLREGEDRSAQPQPAAHEASTAPPAPPTLSLMGRLFAVPFLIIGSIVGGAVLVVLLFAGPAAPQPRSIEQLVQALETTAGGRSLGLLLPRDKELWQAAQELSIRLQEKGEEPELTELRLQSLARRLNAIVEGDFSQLQRTDLSGPVRDRLSKRLQFLLRALARTEQPLAVDALIAVVRSEEEFLSMLATKQLAELHGLPESRRAIAPILENLKGADGPASKLVACTALSVLARDDDREVIDALRSAHAAADGEVQWSAALALARLGSNAGRSTLMDLLDRSYWDSGKRYHTTDDQGGTRRFTMPPQRVDEVLMAAMDAASHLDDSEIWEMIKRLESDRSPSVRGHAASVLKSRT